MLRYATDLEFDPGCNIASNYSYHMCVGGRVVHSLLQLSERPCHIWLVGRMKFASFKANLGWGWGLLVYPILLFSLPLSGRSPDMTEILLTGTLSKLTQLINIQMMSTIAEACK